jgi:hypothetical protein
MSSHKGKQIIRDTIQTVSFEIFEQCLLASIVMGGEQKSYNSYKQNFVM